MIRPPPKNAANPAATALERSSYQRPKPGKVGETLKAIVEPAGATAASYQWKADGEDIEGATAASFTVTKDQLGAKITVSAKGSAGATQTSAATDAVAPAEGVAITKAEQTGTNTVKVTFSNAVTTDDVLSVKKGTADAALDGDPDYSGDFLSATITLKDKITNAKYTVTLTPEDEGIAASSVEFEGKVASLGEIKFLNNYLVMKNNDYDEGYAYVKGYDQFGTEINLSGLTVTAGVGEMTSYDASTGKITLKADSPANAYMFMKQVPVFVSYQTSDGIISQQATLDVTSRSFVDKITFGEIDKEGTKRPDGRLTITELSSGKYYVPLTEVKDQYGNDLDAEDLNGMLGVNPVLFVIPGNTGAYYVTDQFDTIDGEVILWIDSPDDPKPGTMDLTITGAGGATFKKPITIEDDPYIQELTVTYPQLYSGHEKSDFLDFSATDQYGDPIDMWDVRPLYNWPAGNTTDGQVKLYLSDVNHMTGKGTEITLSGGVTFNAVIEDTTAKTWKVNLDTYNGGGVNAVAKGVMAVVTTTTAGMVPYTRSITVGAEGQALQISSALSGGDRELKPRNDKFNFNQYLQFEDANGEIMQRVGSEKYPAFIDGTNLVSVRAANSGLQLKDYNSFVWTVSEEKIAEGTITAGTETPYTIVASDGVDDDGVITASDVQALTNKHTYYVTLFGHISSGANTGYYKLDEQEFRLTYIPSAVSTIKKYEGSISGPIYVDPDNGTAKGVDLTVTNALNEVYKLAEGDGYRVSTDSGLTITDGYKVSGKVSGLTSGTATLDIWTTDNKKRDTITVDYTNEAPVPTKVSFGGDSENEVATGAVGAGDPRVGAEIKFTPSSNRIETSTGTGAVITMNKGVLKITNANNLGDKYEAKIQDQYGNTLENTVFYVNGIAKTNLEATNFVPAGDEIVVKLVNGTVSAEYTIVSGNGGTKWTVQEPKSSAEVTVKTALALEQAIKDAFGDKEVKNTIIVDAANKAAPMALENAVTLGEGDTLVIGDGENVYLAGKLTNKGTIKIGSGAAVAYTAQTGADGTVDCAANNIANISTVVTETYTGAAPKTVAFAAGEAKVGSADMVKSAFASNNATSIKLTDDVALPAGLTALKGSGSVATIDLGGKTMTTGTGLGTTLRIESTGGPKTVTIKNGKIKSAASYGTLFITATGGYGVNVTVDADVEIINTAEADLSTGAFAAGICAGQDATGDKVTLVVKGSVTTESGFDVVCGAEGNDTPLTTDYTFTAGGGQKLDAANAHRMTAYEAVNGDTYYYIAVE